MLLERAVNLIKQNNVAALPPLLDQLTKSELDMRDERGCALVHFAATFGHADCLNAVLEAGASVDNTTLQGDTPLHLAAFAGHVDVVCALLLAGADRSIRNDDGILPVDLAESDVVIQNLLRKV